LRFRLRSHGGATHYSRREDQSPAAKDQRITLGTLGGRPPALSGVSPCLASGAGIAAGRQGADGS
jgi:hypothetical protein